MAEHKSIELTETENMDSSKQMQAQTAYDAKLRRFTALLDLSKTAVADGDTVLIARVPQAYRFAYGLITSSVSLATATLAVSSRHIDPATKAEVKNSGKYRAAAVVTTAQVPLLFGKAGASAEKDAPEEVYLEAGTAAFPSSGLLQVDLFFSAAL